MSGHALDDVKDKVAAFGMKLVDIIYNASVFTVIGYGAILLFLLVIGIAVGFNIVNIPEFHPR
ncbi:hypothetical protein LG047_01840 [Methylocystis sp. WRRC1]|uniref:hypothetical protein n=1 Tax=Methylocystis sp. WRRC1 TaxID=1732014 RepID=UPI001D14A05F|nr:hypothetical protein [Methylocystis sp. WRRC1]MCC3244071.1 hypothetical protein [Methylocystis sp. WRRC1]